MVNKANGELTGVKKRVFGAQNEKSGVYGELLKHY